MPQLSKIESIQHMTTRSKFIQSIGHTGTTLLSHIPCCGPQLLLFSGTQIIVGETATHLLYQAQFITPWLTAAFFTFGPGRKWLVSKKHCAEHTHCAPTCQDKPISNTRRFVESVVLGYIIVACLYVLIPRTMHNHEHQNTHVESEHHDH